MEEANVEKEKKCAGTLETDHCNEPENCIDDADSHICEEGRETGGFNVESNVDVEFNGNNDSDGMAIDGENSPEYKEPLSLDQLEKLHEPFELNPLTNHVVISENRVDDSVLVCSYPQCEFSATDTGEYLKHEYEHVDGKSYECDLCHLKFNHFQTMHLHRMTHLTQRPYDCRLCSKTFQDVDCLLDHLVKQHSKQRPYHCPFCVRHFKSRTLLKTHLSTDHCAAVLIKTCKLCGFKAISTNFCKNHLAVCYYNKSRMLVQRKGLDAPPMQIGSKVTAIDLGTISQNFSFAPAHFAPFTIISADNGHSVAGPSEAVPDIPLHTTTPAALNFSTEKYPRDQVPVAPANLSPVTSSASSTTVVSPSANSPQNLAMTTIRVLVKSEPPEPVDDSQNGCSLPTSTMDLSTANVVETSYNSNDAQQTSPDLPFSLKVCGSRDDERLRRGKMLPQLIEKPHVVAKRGYYANSRIKSGGASRETSCYCCRVDSGHTQHWKKREANSETENSNACEHSHYNCMESCCSSQTRETQTELAAESHFSTHHSSSHPHENYSDDPSVNRSNPVDCKSHIVFQKDEGSLLSCPYCEIMFPDQTLYFLHRSLHSETHPWKCNLCGKILNDRYDFNSHIISQGHH